MTPVLEVKGLCKRMGDFELKDINFSLDSGYIMGFIGPNGAGKSTTIKAILNQISRDSGEITLWGRDNIENEISLKDRIGVVLDEGHFYGHLTLKKMTNIIAPFYSNWDAETYRRFLDEFGLDDRKKISALSKGMRMKYSIAIALSHHADLLIMDEPTSGLDPLVRDELLGILQNMIQDERKSVFFSTHITSDLDKIADYIVLINNGRLLFSRSKDELLDGHALVKGPPELLDGDIKSLLIGIRRGGYGFEALTGDRAAVAAALGGRAVLERPSIEDIMLYYVREDGKDVLFN